MPVVETGSDQSGQGHVEEHYDLSGLADRLGVASRFRRLFLLSVTGMSAAFSFVGLYLILTVGADLWTARSFLPWALLIGFGLIAIYSFRRSQAVAPALRELTFSDVTIRFGVTGSKTGQELRWTDPAFSLEIYDRTETPPVEVDGSDRVLDFIVDLEGGPRTPIPRQAFDYIIHRAHEFGLEVRRESAQQLSDSRCGQLVLIRARAE